MPAEQPPSFPTFPLSSYVEGHGDRRLSEIESSGFRVIYASGEEGSWRLPVGDRYSLPSRFEVEVDSEEYPVVIRLEVAVEGQPARASIEAVRFDRRSDGVQVNGAALRRVPLDRILRRAVELAAMDRDHGLPVATRWLPRRSVEGFRDTYRPAASPSRRWQLDADHLSEVAEVYREAVSMGRNDPTVAVAQHFKRPRSTAARWVRAARDDGFLGKAIEKRAGELPATGEDDQ